MKVVKENPKETYKPEYLTLPEYVQYVAGACLTAAVHESGKWPCNSFLMNEVNTGIWQYHPERFGFDSEGNVLPEYVNSKVISDEMLEELQSIHWYSPFLHVTDMYRSKDNWEEEKLLELAKKEREKLLAKMINAMDSICQLIYGKQVII